MAKFQEEKAIRKLELLRRKEEEESAKIVADKYNLPYIDISKVPVEIDALKILPESKARTSQLVVFQKTGKHLKIALRNPEKEETRAVLKRLEEERYTWDLYMTSQAGLRHAWEFYKKVPEEHKTEAGSIQVSPQKLEVLKKEITNLNEIVSRIEKVLGTPTPTTEILEIVLAGSLVMDASDVHIEPQPESVRLRFRMDGILQDITFISRRLYELLLSRIKLISELKLNIHDRAQDGRFTIKTDNAQIEVRVSTLPGPQGENVVLRILNPKTIQIPFEELGMQPWIYALVEEELKKPNGMILTTGPTGSGKTTTLYAFLKKIHTPDIKIITIEDPIEYHLKGVEQTQVDAEKGYSFTNGLRAIVRQDPDVILVGEIRDLETAETAMHASLTGHLVFSTLHTNDAAGTISRLLDLGVKPAIIAPAINVSMAQRLVRRLCKECRTLLKPETSDRKKLEEELAKFPKNIPIPPFKEWILFKAKKEGCLTCHHMGYKGRIGVFEIILIDEKIEQLILKDPSEFEIKKTAAGQGQINMRQDGILKILAGVTDFAELERVIGT